MQSWSQRFAVAQSTHIVLHQSQHHTQTKSVEESNEKTRNSIVFKNLLPPPPSSTSSSFDKRPRIPSHSTLWILKRRVVWDTKCGATVNCCRTDNIGEVFIIRDYWLMGINARWNSVTIWIRWDDEGRTTRHVCATPPPLATHFYSENTFLSQFWNVEKNVNSRNFNFHQMPVSARLCVTHRNCMTISICFSIYHPILLFDVNVSRLNSRLRPSTNCPELHSRSPSPSRSSHWWWREIFSWIERAMEKKEKQKRKIENSPPPQSSSPTVIDNKSVSQPALSFTNRAGGRRWKSSVEMV